MAGCREQEWDKGSKSPVGPTLVFPASFVGEGQPGFKEQGGQGRSQGLDKGLLKE